VEKGDALRRVDVNGERGAAVPRAIRGIPFLPGNTHAGRTVLSFVCIRAKPAASRAHHRVDVRGSASRFSCTMRVDCGQLDPGAGVRRTDTIGSRIAVADA
jgi:hypothetical protein